MNGKTVSLERQKARCAFAALAMGHAVLALPEEIPVSMDAKKLARICARVTKWLDLACQEVGARKLPPLNGQAVARLMKNFVRKAYPARPDLAQCCAGFWATVVFLWDVRITCPDAARSATWRYLARAAEELGRILLACASGADETGEKIYEELVW